MLLDLKVALKVLKAVSLSLSLKFKTFITVFMAASVMFGECFSLSRVSRPVALELRSLACYRSVRQTVGCNFAGGNLEARESDFVFTELPREREKVRKSNFDLLFWAIFDFFSVQKRRTIGNEETQKSGFFEGASRPDNLLSSEHVNSISI